ncbi:MAG: archaeal proteasome endopeptidase complex subunit alpha [Candidatus Bathyarchaeota archaeon]|nr:archaeal proteasome endopeptidase complex subunit alpha [Candidatus Termiticorpusculum sp.]
MSAFTRPGTYDYNATVFSPDGRLYQVEYVTELLNRGATIIGIKCPEGVVLASEENAEPLEETEHSLKIFQIDNHIGVAIVGLGSDARILIQKAREEAQSNKLTYDEPIDVETITKKSSNIQQVYTQHGGGRPFGAALIVAGVDKTGPHIFCTHQSGTYKAYKATSLGAGRETVQTQLIEQYKENMTLNDTIILAINCLKNSMETRQTTAKITIAIIPTTTKQIKILTDTETEKFINQTPS